MANTLENTLNKVGNTIETIMGTRKASPSVNPNRSYTGQTCLERFGIEARGEHLFRNEWKRDLQYTKALVDAEYLIQTEFKVSSYQDRLTEREISDDKIARLEEKKKRYEDKINKINERIGDAKYPKENISKK